MFYSHICAVGANNTIGFKGKLPWHIPEDLRFFKQKTKAKALIMGRKTFESLGEPLPHRLNVVVSRQKKFKAKTESVTYWQARGRAGEQVGAQAGAQARGQAVAPAGKQVEQKHIMLNALKQNSPLVICSSLPDAMDFCSTQAVLQKYGREVFIIGGGEIYKQSLPLVQKIYLTRIHKNYKGDAFYPAIPKEEFKEVQKRACPGPPPYSFITYERITRSKISG